jgi:hypothetical protein
MELQSMSARLDEKELSAEGGRSACLAAPLRANAPLRRFRAR